ncbi:MATE family efflux transporter [Pseudothermotoga thermarum]|uniref:MATE family efflux transporter n=1 Tax=Pseudothermotoga thermarum TaxID=119394 RepID=UPI0002FB3A00|nr:MATE family efflux transporter [Pseudothermotoga thermarum]
MLIKIGTPVLAMHVFNSLGFMFQNRLVNSFGVVAAAAFAIGFLIMDLADATMWGITQPVAIMIGQNLGAGNLERSKKIAWRTVLFVLVTTYVGVVLVYSIREWVIWAFTDNLEIYAEALRFINIFMWSLPFFAVFFVAMSVGRGSGRTLVPTIIGFIRIWGLRIALGSILAYILNMEIIGVWVAMTISNFIGGIVSILWIKYGNWNSPIIKRTLPTHSR